MFRHLQDCFFRKTGTISVSATHCVKFQYIWWTKNPLNLMNSDVIRHRQNSVAEAYVVTEE